MDCHECQELLFEYVEGSLSAIKRAEFETHLTDCETCTEAVRRENRMEARLSTCFRENVQTLTLGEEGREKLMKAFTRSGRPTQGAWTRLLTERWIELTAALGTAAALLTVLVWVGTQRRTQSMKHSLVAKPVPMQTPATTPTIQIRLPYLVRSYTFKQNGDFVVDTLIEQTNLVNVTLWGEISSSTEPNANEKRLPL